MGASFATRGVEKRKRLASGGEHRKKGKARSDGGWREGWREEKGHSLTEFLAPPNMLMVPDTHSLSPYPCTLPLSSCLRAV